MADHAIGSRISLVSKAEIRYEGFLHFINPEENTVGLKDVRMLGTQGRRGGQGEVEANQTTYDFIIFRGGDIKDLTVFDDNTPQPEPPRNDHINDPAIMSSKAAPASSFAERAVNNNNNHGRDRREDRRGDFGTARQSGGGFYDNNRRDDRFDNRRDDRFGDNRRDDRFGDNRRGGFDSNRRDNYNNGGYGGRGGSRIGGYEGGRGGRGGGYNNNNGGSQYDRHRGDFDAPRPEYHTGRDFDVACNDKKERLEPFDFAKANAEFEKQKAEFEKAKEEVLKANAGRTYDKNSFFDNISSEADRRAGGFNFRPDRDEQRRADVQTFGQEAVGNMRGFRRGRGGRGRYGRN